MMIEKTAKIKSMKDKKSFADDLEFWMSKTPEERVATVDFLRNQFYGSSTRLQRVFKVFQRK